MLTPSNTLCSSPSPIQLHPLQSLGTPLFLLLQGTRGPLYVHPFFLVAPEAKTYPREPGLNGVRGEGEMRW